jgi:hypothetical protein
VDTISFDRIGEKLVRAQALTDDDAQELAATYDIISLGALADSVRRHKHGAATTFIRVAGVALADAIEGRVEWAPAAHELRILGPPTSLDEAQSAVRAVSAAAPPLPVTGFSLADLLTLAGDRQGLVAFLRVLKDEGLSFIAEAPVDEIGDLEAALAASRDAQLPVARLTVGSPSSSGPVAVFRRVLEAHRAMDAVSVFAPLPRRQGPEPSTGYEDVRAVALARILLPIDHVQVDWQTHGPKLAQVALTFGADDIDNVAAADDLSQGSRRAPLEEIRRNIRAAAFEPVERDPQFVPVR